MTLARLLDTIKPGLPPWGPHVRFRRVQTLVREGSPLVKLRNSEFDSLQVEWSHGSIVYCPDDLIIRERDADLRCLVQSAAIVRRIGEGRGGGPQQLKWSRSA